nr:ribonuclease H-like domain-containing protein [Tanacetum cinerariifolium]
MYCLVVIDDYSRFTWVFFLATKDETSCILKSFITRIENLIDHKVKAEAVSTACYVQNKVLVVKPHNKTPYELFHGRTPTFKFCETIWCPVSIFSTIDHLGKFDGKADQGFFVGYSFNSKAFRVFNNKTRIVKENLHIRFSETTPNVVGSGPDWLFDIDALTITMNYEPIIAGTQSNGFADPKSSHDDGSKPLSDNGKKADEDSRKESECEDQEKEDNVNKTNNVNTIGNVNTISSTVNVAGINKVNVVGGKISIELLFDLKMPTLEDDSIFDFLNDDENDDAVADINNLDTTIQIEEEVYVCQPPGFEDLDFPDRVYKMENDKTLFIKRHKGDILLVQVYVDDIIFVSTKKELCITFEKLMHEKFQMSCMGELTFFLGLQVKQKKEDSGFKRGKTNKTLFIKRHKGDILLVQVYVDDIIFVSTKKELCITFEKLMHEKFQMSCMGELTFFLGLQVKQKKEDEAVHEELGNGLVRATTTASSLEAEHDS